MTPSQLGCEFLPEGHILSFLFYLREIFPLVRIADRKKNLCSQQWNNPNNFHRLWIFSAPHHATHELILSLFIKGHEAVDEERKHELKGRMVGPKSFVNIGSQCPFLILTLILSFSQAVVWASLRVLILLIILILNN